MSKQIGLERSLLTYGLSIPLALILGYLVASAMGYTNYILVGLVLFGMTVPLWLRWHHPMLIIFWNSTFIVFFLPGQPPLGIVLAGFSLFITVLDKTLDKRKELIYVPSVARPLICLFIVVAITAACTGGIGGRSLGAEEWGAKRYMGVFGAIIGYFAITALRIPMERAQLFASLYFLSGVSAIGSDLVYAAGPGLYFLFALFPSELAYLQASSEKLTRITGLAWSSNAVVFFLLLRYGIRGLLDMRRPWRLIFFLGCVGIGMFGGFRSTLILLILLLSSQFYFEGLYKTHYMPILLMGTLLVGSFVVTFVDKMPLALQRSLSFLPLKIDPVARNDAFGTLDWRIQMWKTVLPDVPRYFFLGKGYTYSGTDYILTQEAFKRGMIHTSYEHTLVSGNYHNGILTIIIPFGIWGILCFVWFAWAASRVMYRNYLYGADSIQNINTFLVSIFAARLCFYVVFYGQFDLDLVHFTGLVALSMAINGGVRSEADKRAEREAEAETESESVEVSSSPVPALPG